MFSLKTVTINWKKIWNLTHKPIYGLLFILSYWSSLNVSSLTLVLIEKVIIATHKLSRVRQNNIVFKGLSSPPHKMPSPSI